MSDRERDDDDNGKAADPWQGAEVKPGRGGREQAPGWEREVVIKLATEAVREQRRARRWGIFFKGLVLLYLIAVLALFRFELFATDGLDAGPHVGVVSLSGVIADGEPAGAGLVNRGLRAAFKDEDTRAVVLKINSPGGSPVQSGMIYDEIKRLREAHPEIKLYAVVEDICASGGYFVAAAADEIHADRASVVGSIGVIMGGFGFVEAMDKLGVERRLLTAGENKALLDPFSPAKEADVEHLQGLLDDIHGQFIARVKQGRGDRLADDPELFSGLVWTGEQALAKGLVDGFGSARSVARDIVGVDKLVDFTPHEDLISRLADRIGASFGRVLMAAGWQWR